MQHADVLEAVRRLVRRSFAELGAGPDVQISETILVRHNHYCGRRFRGSGLHAVWFIEEDEIKLYARDGEMVRVTSAREALQDAPVEAVAPAWQRRAA
jgi:hypothetical protein